MRFLIISIVLAISIIQTPVKADIVWQYTFESEIPSDWRSEFPSDWRIGNGNFTVQDGYLTATECISPLNNGFCTVSLWLNSTVRTGRWSLDYFRSDPTNIFALFFMGQGVAENSNDHWPETGNVLTLLGSNEPGVEFGGSVEPGVFDVVKLSNFDFGINWIHIDITRNDTGEMNLYIDNELIVTTSKGINSSEYINLQFGNNDRIDNFTLYDSILEDIIPISQESSIDISSDLDTSSDTTTLANITTSDSSDTNKTFFYVVGGLTGISTLIYSTIFIIKKNKLAKILKQGKIDNIIYNSAKDFELSDYSMLTLISGIKQVDNNSQKYLPDDIPQELIKYRYLMHPIRLTIMKLLNYENKMISSTIRSRLGTSWGEYRTHLKSLEEKGYIMINDDFNEEGSVVQVVYIEEVGRLEYQTLFHLLQEFTAQQSPYNNISSQDPFDPDNKNLYPHWK